ncbi:UNVERIFIED_CONTAM: hypothetical protein K2H54_057497 [Gekko kuhli]
METYSVVLRLGLASHHRLILLVDCLVLHYRLRLLGQRADGGGGAPVPRRDSSAAVAARALPEVMPQQWCNLSIVFYGPRDYSSAQSNFVNLSDEQFWRTCKLAH